MMRLASASQMARTCSSTRRMVPPGSIGAHQPRSGTTAHFIRRRRSWASSLKQPGSAWSCCITNCISAARRPSRWSTRCDRCSTGKCSTAETSMCTSVAGRYRARGALEPLQCDSWFHSRAGAWRYHLHRWSARFRHPTDARALLRVLVVGKEVDSHELLRTL